MSGVLSDRDTLRFEDASSRARFLCAKPEMGDTNMPSAVERDLQHQLRSDIDADRRTCTWDTYVVDYPSLQGYIDDLRYAHGIDSRFLKGCK